MAKCPVCKIEQYGYEWTTTKNGKKWLQNKEGKWHDCPLSVKKPFTPKNEGKYVFYDIKSTDFDFCEYCGTMIYKEYIYEKYSALRKHGTLNEHIERWHPNEEILDSIDFMPLTEEQKENKRKQWNVTKIFGKYYLQGKVLKQEGNRDNIFY